MDAKTEANLAVRFALGMLPENARPHAIARMLDRTIAMKGAKLSPVARSAANAFSQAALQNGVLVRVKCDSLADAVESWLRVRSIATAEKMLDEDKTSVRFHDMDPTIELTNGSAVEVSRRLGTCGIVPALLAMVMKEKGF